MTRARRASRPRFRLLPTVLLTLAILGVPTVVYAWGRNSSSFDIKHRDASPARTSCRDKRACKLLRHDYLGHNLFTVTGEDVRGTLQPLSLRRRRDGGPRLSRHARGDHHRVPAGGLRAGRRPLVRGRRERLRRSAPPPRRPPSCPRGRKPARRALRAGVRLAVARRPRRHADAATAGDASATTTPAAGAGAPPATPTIGGAADTGSCRPGDSSPARTRRRCRCPRIAVVRPGPQGRRAHRQGAPPRCSRVITALPRSLRRRWPRCEDDGGQLTLRFAGGPVTVVGRLLADARQDGRPAHGARQVRRDAARRAPSSTSPSPTGRWRSRCSSDGRGPVQPVVEPGSPAGSRSGRCLTPPRGVGKVSRGSGHQVFPADSVAQESLQKRLFVGAHAG